MTYAVFVTMSNYAFLHQIEKIYCSPLEILGNFSLPLCKKIERLSRWYNDRSKYLFEHGREFDFQADAVLNDLYTSLNLLRSIEDSFEKEIYYRHKNGSVSLHY